MTLKRELFIFVCAFAIYFGTWVVAHTLKINSLPIQSEDTVPALFFPLAVIKEHTFFLDNYVPVMLQRYPHPDDPNQYLELVPFYLKKVGDHYLSAFPIITPLVALPIYYLFYLGGSSFTWEVLGYIAHLFGSLVTAAAVLVFYRLVISKFNLAVKPALVLTLVYAFGTINYALVSQGMWQHGTVQLLLILALDHLLSHKQSSPILFGLFGGLAVLSRPTAILPILLFGVYALLKKKHLVKIGLGLLLPVLFFLWYNSVFYNGIENQGYTSQLFKNWLGGFPQSFFGVWFSPSKGILVFSPILVFAFIGLIYAKKTDFYTRYLYYLLGFIVICHTLIISFWKHWFGGWSFGYRMSSDVLPFLTLLIIPWLKAQVTQKKLTLMFTILLLLSIVIEIYGVFFFDGVWHAAYDKGFENTDWLWSLKDSEFMFDFRRVLVKLGYLGKACELCSVNP